MIKAIFSDLDGTLLQDDHTYSETTKRVVNAVQDKGLPFIIATGRLFKNAYDNALLLNIDKHKGYFIANNGACIYSFKDAAVIYEKLIDSEDVQRLYRFAKDNQFKIHLFSYTSSYVSEVGENSSYWSKIMDTRYLVIDNVDAIVEQITHASIIARHELSNKAMQRLVERLHRAFPNLDFKRFSNRLLEATAHGVSKGSALCYLSNHLTIEPKDTISFGDGANDISLVQAAGVGLAVDNAVTDLKDAADDVILSNQEHGPAVYLETWLLK